MDLVCGDIALSETDRGIFERELDDGTRLRYDGPGGTASVFRPDGSLRAEAPASGPYEAWELFDAHVERSGGGFGTSPEGRPTIVPGYLAGKEE